MQGIMFRIFPVVIALGFGGLVLIVGGRYPPIKSIGTGRFLVGMRKKKERGVGVRNRLEGYLEKYGARYHYGKHCGVIQLFLTSLLLMAVGWIIGLKIAMYVSIAAGGFGLLLPWLILPLLNKSDNEKMLPDLRLVYHALAMQIKASVYVTDALVEMYSGVENRRLKEALLDLGGDIVVNSDLITALERFRNRFDNRYIDSLCITIIQAMESGQAVELLSDIAEQVKDMEKMVLDKKKGFLDRSITFYQLGMLSCVLAVAIYACINYMLTSAVGL